MCWPVYGFEGPRELAGAPVWNPFLKRRETSLRYLMRPVPVVFLRFAFSPQLTVESPVSAVFLFHVANFMPVAPGEGEQAGIS